MTIRDELLAIQAANQEGILHAREVVDWARNNPGSALHSAMEWNDEKAADEYRVWQARRLVQLHIVTEDGAPQMVSLSIDRADKGGYRAVSDVVKRPDLRDVMLRDALAELERMQEKYSRVEALSGLWREADAVRERAGIKRRRKAEEPAGTQAAA